MKTMWIAVSSIWMLLAAGPLAAQDKEPVDKKISVQLQNVPLREAVSGMLTNAGYQWSIDPQVQNFPVSLAVKEVSFDTALRLLIRQAAVVQPGLTYTKDGGFYRIHVKAPQPPSPPALQIAKLAVQFLDVAELEKRLSSLPAPDGITSTQALPADNALLVHGFPDAIEGLKRILRLIDVPARSLTIHVGVTGPGVGNRPLQLGSMARTLNGKEVVLEDETTSLGGMARLRVQVRPIVQGDGQVLTQSDWDLSVPVAGGPQGPIRLVKRLTTTARLQTNRGITVGEVDLAPFGGNGTVRLWLRAVVLPDAVTVRASTDADEPLGHVEVLGNKPYISVFGLADLLNGRLKRGARGGFEVAPGPDLNPGALLKADKPENSGPFRLTVGDRTISDFLVFGMAISDGGRLEPDREGEPFIPLEDLAAALNARLTYDSARDAYQFRGGHRLSTLRFSSPPRAENR